MFTLFDSIYNSILLLKFLKLNRTIKSIKLPQLLDDKQQVS